MSDDLYEMLGEGMDDDTPGEMAGEGTEEKPYLIQSIEDLVYLSNQVKAGTTYENHFIKLAVNLDFQSEKSYVDYTNKTYKDINGNSQEEELKTELTTGTGFPAIGNASKQFRGTFNGNNHTINNLYIKSEEDCKGLFGYVGDNGTIKNLTISNADIDCKSLQIGTLAGRVGKGTIENIKVDKGIVKGNRYVGGIIGNLFNSGIVNNCINGNNVTVYGANINTDTDNIYHSVGGGIVGNSDNSTITNSYNQGQIKSEKGIVAGGIIGNALNNTKVEFCYNVGKVGDLIKENTVYQIGGIVGTLYNNSKVSKCYNVGEIYGNRFVGGIVGLQGYNSKAYIEDCYNTGTITAILANAGGISAVVSTTTGSEITNCYNVGTVSVTEPANRNIRKCSRDIK